MLDTVKFFVNLDDQPVSRDDQYTVRNARLFRCGDYPDKNFSMDEAEMSQAVAGFKPSFIDLEHTDTVLNGKLGWLRDVSQQGPELYGQVKLPNWLDSTLPPDRRKVSATFDRKTKALTRISLVRNPRVSDAVLMAAFSAANPQLADEATMALLATDGGVVPRGAVAAGVQGAATPAPNPTTAPLPGQGQHNPAPPEPPPNQIEHGPKLFQQISDLLDDAFNSIDTSVLSDDYVSALEEIQQLCYANGAQGGDDSGGSGSTGDQSDVEQSADSTQTGTNPMPGKMPPKGMPSKGKGPPPKGPPGKKFGADDPQQANPGQAMMAQLQNYAQSMTTSQDEATVVGGHEFSNHLTNVDPENPDVAALAEAARQWANIIPDQDAANVKQIINQYAPNQPNMQRTAMSQNNVAAPFQTSAKQAAANPQTVLSAAVFTSNPTNPSPVRAATSPTPPVAVIPSRAGTRRLSPNEQQLLDRAIRAEAAMFANEELQSNRIFPSEKDALISDYIQAAMDDAANPVPVVFADGQTQGTRVDKLKARQASRPPHELTQEHFSGGPGTTVLTSPERTSDPNGPMDPEKKKKALEATHTGREALKQASKNGQK